MLSWLAPLLVLGLVIFVHELGHFLAAKWAGVYAPRFSLGWGSPVWSFRRGETEYCISALPIGQLSQKKILKKSAHAFRC